MSRCLYSNEPSFYLKNEGIITFSIKHLPFQMSSISSLAERRDNVTLQDRCLEFSDKVLDLVESPFRRIITNFGFRP